MDVRFYFEKEVVDGRLRGESRRRRTLRAHDDDEDDDEGKELFVSRVSLSKEFVIFKLMRA